MSKEIELEVLRLAPQAETQGSLARQLGFSASKTHYILTSLIEKGLIKAERFKRSDNKLAYRYLLTPQGIMRRITLTEKYIQYKKQEYETLQHELEQLSALRQSPAFATTSEAGTATVPLQAVCTHSPSEQIR